MAAAAGDRWTREVARGLVCAYHGLEIRSLMLLPIGGFAVVRDAGVGGAGIGRKRTIALAMAGPITNFLAAFDFAGFYSGSFAERFGVGQTLGERRALVAQCVLAQYFPCGREPAPSLSAGCRKIGPRQFFARSRSPEGNPRRVRDRPGDRFGIFVAGVILQSPWLLLAGFFIFVGAQLEDQGLVFQSVVDTVRMRDIMLTDFACFLPPTHWRMRSINHP